MQANVGHSYRLRDEIKSIRESKTQKLYGVCGDMESFDDHKPRKCTETVESDKDDRMRATFEGVDSRYFYAASDFIDCGVLNDKFVVGKKYAVREDLRREPRYMGYGVKECTEAIVNVTEKGTTWLVKLCGVQSFATPQDPADFVEIGEFVSFSTKDEYAKFIEDAAYKEGMRQAAERDKTITNALYGKAAQTFAQYSSAVSSDVTDAIIPLCWDGKYDHEWLVIKPHDPNFKPFITGGKTMETHEELATYDKANLAEAKKKFDEERASKETDMALTRLRNAHDAIETINRDIKLLQERKIPHQKIIDVFKKGK